jgi:hypothetical protein
MNFSLPNLIGGFVFGVLGFAAWRYGRSVQEWRPMVTGFALMVFPYFVESTGWLFGVGIALVVSLFLFHG